MVDLVKKTVLTMFVVMMILTACLQRDRFQNNLAWIYLAKASSAMPQVELAYKSLNLFDNVIANDEVNQRVVLGKGIAYLALGDREIAWDIWQEANIDPSILVSMGNNFKGQQELDKALLYYRGAISLSAINVEVEFLSGNICQLALFAPGVLSQSNSRYCRRHFSQNNDNLIINGQFSSGNLAGWNLHRDSGTNYGVDMSTGRTSPSAFLAGNTKQYHGGLFQSINLPPGVSVRYSMWLRIQGGSEVAVYPLYFRAQRNDERVVGAGEPLSDNTDWVYLERIFQVPEVDEAHFKFYPVFFKGQGNVWIDDVRLVIQGIE